MGRKDWLACARMSVGARQQLASAHTTYTHTNLPPHAFTGTIKATCLIETLPAAFEMDEFIYELRDHMAGGPPPAQAGAHARPWCVRGP